MPKTDADEAQLVQAYDRGSLKSVATKSELSKFKAAARATAIKDRRVNIRLSSGDLQDIQVKALEEGLPYQTLIASALYKYVTGRLAEREGGQNTSRLPQNSLLRRASKGDA
jgi:predicted DNA binding CopG/RHH family protein